MRLRQLCNPVLGALKPLDDRFCAWSLSDKEDNRCYEEAKKEECPQGSNYAAF